MPMLHALAVAKIWDLASQMLLLRYGFQLPAHVPGAYWKRPR